MSTLLIIPLCLLFSAAPTLKDRSSIIDYVDVVEFNSFYDNEGRKIFDQIIYWDYDITGTKVVRAWKLNRSNHLLVMEERSRRHSWSVRFFDGEVYRIIYAKHKTNTHTDFDPELENRKIVANDKRFGFTKPRLERKYKGFSKTYAPE